jgi:hypothetical protein
MMTTGSNNISRRQKELFFGSSARIIGAGQHRPGEEATAMTIKVLKSEKMPNGQTKEIHEVEGYDDRFRVAVYTEDGLDWDWENCESLAAAEIYFAQINNIDELGA